MMRAALLSSAIVATLVGCASVGPPVGNFMPAAKATEIQKLAADAVRQMVAVYPPASTRLHFEQATPDPFGQSLLSALRGNGYAVMEFHGSLTPEITGTTGRPSPASDAIAPRRSPPPPVTLRYLVDQAGQTNLVRVVLMVGDQSLTRAYVAQDGTLAPAGAWLRKE